MTTPRTKPLNPRSSQRGWVTVEFAFVALGLAFVAVFAAGIGRVAILHLQCNDAAAAIARQAARNDLVAVDHIVGELDPILKVQTAHEGTDEVVTVTGVVQPWGTWLPPITVRSVSRVVGETP